MYKHATMKTNILLTAIERIPLDVRVNDTVYHGEALVKKLPSAKIFACDIDGLGIYVLISISDPVTKKYNWLIDKSNEDDMIMPLVGREIERYTSAA